MATKAHITIDQGSTFTVTIDLTDESDTAINLAGYTGTSQIRKTFTSLTGTDFAVGINAPAGTVTLSLTSTQTAGLIAGRYVYDVELTSAGGTVSRIIEGIVTVTPQVTKNANTGI